MSAGQEGEGQEGGGRRTVQRTSAQPEKPPAQKPPAHKPPAQQTQPQRATSQRPLPQKPLTRKELPQKTLRRPELQVNPIACEAHGICIELLPELIRSDPWGYPVLRPGPVPLHLQDLARRAVADCPTLALRLVLPE